jgi:hypothetical protein
MKTRRKLLLIAFVTGLAGIVRTVWSGQRPMRLTQEFIEHLSNQRYADAEKMLAASCTISLRTSVFSSVPIEQSVLKNLNGLQTSLWH